MHVGELSELFCNFIGLKDYCRFGRWTEEENKQLKKNWKKATKVTTYF